MSRSAAVAAALAIVLISASLGGVALAADSAVAAPAVQQNNSTVEQTATPEPSETDDWEPPGPFSLDELRTGGEHPSDAPASTRYLGDPVRGTIGVRVTPVSLLNQDPSFVEPGQTVENDRIELYSSAFADATGEYTVVIAFWNEEKKTVQTEDGTTEVSYAADQEVQRVSVDVGSGYDANPIKLKSHYDAKMQATMWLETPGGERIEGARWRFVHRSNPLTAAPSSPVNSEGDLWRWGGINILLPAIPGIFVGRKAATHMLDRTIVGPQKGAGFWIGLAAFVSFIAAAGATWQAASVLAKAPWVAGLLIFVLSFIAFLGFRDQEVEKAEFNEKDLTDYVNIEGEDSVKATNEHIDLKSIVRRAGNIYAPKPGIRPFLARYWADAAAVAEKDLETVINCEGDISKKYILDPESDEPLVHKPARLVFSPTLITEPEPAVPDGGSGPDGGLADVPKAAVGAAEGVFSRINWAFVLPAVAGGAIVYSAIMSWLGVQSIALAIAMLPALVAGHESRDGSLEFDPAPYHFSPAEAILAFERKTHQEAATWQEMEEAMADVRLDSIERTQDLVEAFKRQVDDRLSGIHGLGKEEDVSGELSATTDSSSTSEPGVSDD